MLIKNIGTSIYPCCFCEVVSLYGNCWPHAFSHRKFHEVNSRWQKSVAIVSQTKTNFSPDFGKKCKSPTNRFLLPKAAGPEKLWWVPGFWLWRSPQQIFFQALTVASTFLPTEICGKIRPKSDFLWEILSWILALLKPQRFGALGRNVEAASSSGAGGAATNPMTRGLVGEDAPMTRVF